MFSFFFLLPYLVQAVLAFALAVVWLCGWWRGLGGPALGLLVFACVGFAITGLLAAGFYFFAYQGNTMSVTNRVALLDTGGLALSALTIALQLLYAVGVYLFAWQGPSTQDNPLS